VKNLLYQSRPYCISNKLYSDDDNKINDSYKFISFILFKIFNAYFLAPFIKLLIFLS
jgi:hypothetical protein